jgi:hypothetical protein
MDLVKYAISVEKLKRYVCVKMDLKMVNALIVRERENEN